MLIVSLIVLISVSFSQGRFFDSNLPSPKIINGKDAKNGEFPYLVSLQSLHFSEHFCAGSILSSQHVLTAAHCVIFENARTMKVVAGTLKLDEPKSTHYISNIVLHTQVDYKETWKNDIALVKVIEPFKISKTINIIHLPKGNLKIKVNQKATIAGWGDLKVGGSKPNHLQKAEIFIADQSLCTELYKKENRTIYDSQICAYDPKSIKGACLHDSGDPLVVKGILVGFASWGYNCVDTINPTVFTRVTSYIKWITKNMH